MPVLLPLEQGVNFRDLGGYRTKDGHQIKANKVIRAASLGNLSPKDVNFLAEYGLRHDVDFRSSEEQENAPDKVPTGATYHFAPVFPELTMISYWLIVQRKRIGISLMSC